MNLAAERHQAIGVVAAEPGGPAEQAGVFFADAQVTDFVLTQFQADVVVQRIAQGEAHQRTERLVARADWQEFMETRPAQLAHVDAELAAAVAHALAEHGVLAEAAVGAAEAVALLVQHRHLALQALLDEKLRVLEVVAQHRLDQRRRVGAQTEQAEVGQQALPVQLLSLADLLAAQADQGEQVRREGIHRTALEAGAVAVLLPDRQQQALQAVVEQVEEVPRRVAILAVAQGLFAVERRQRRATAEQADQVDAHARTQFAMLLEELHAIDIAARKTQARVGLELQVLVEALLIQMRMSSPQALQHQLYGLEQAVLADAFAQST